jgi:protein phosphatase
MPAAGTGKLSDDQLDSVLSGQPSRKERRAERRRQRPQRSRLTWRVLLFTLLVLGVIGGAFATIQWYGTSTYYVAFDGDEVVIYQGRPGGILWVDPELEERTGIERTDVPERYVPAILAGNEQPSLARAQQLVSNIERDIDDGETDSGAPTTSTTEGAGTTTSSTAGTTTQAN